MGATPEGKAGRKGMNNKKEKFFLKKKKKKKLTSKKFPFLHDAARYRKGKDTDGKPFAAFRLCKKVLVNNVRH
jgi:hypothetical protein